MFTTWKKPRCLWPDGKQSAWNRTHIQSKPKWLIKPFGICFGFGFWTEMSCKSFSKAEGKVQQPVRGVLALPRSICLAYRCVINCLKWWLVVQTSKTMWKCTEMKHCPERPPVFLQVHFKPICQINSRTKFTKILRNKKALEIFPSIRRKNLYNIVLNILISSPEFSVTACWVEIWMRSWLLKKRI